MRHFLKLALGLFLCVTPLFAQTALHGTGSNITVQYPNNFACFPVNENGPAAPVPYTCPGYGTVLQTTTTFTSLTAIVDRPVVGSQQVSLVVEDFTTGNNLINTPCLITANQMACSLSFSVTLSAGDILAIKIFNGFSGASSYYNIEKISWVLQ